MVRHNRLGQCALGVDNIGRVSRRTWLAGALLGLPAAYGSIRPAFSQQVKGGESKGDSDTAEIEQVQAVAKKAGLERFTYSRTPHFLGIGDANARFRTDALNICESLAPVFLQHFNAKEFKLAMPKNRLTVITLKGAESYKAFIGEDPGAIRGGHYDLDTNRLVMFDFRPEGEGPGVVNDPTRVNRMTLVHEATHLLCFNTGLLSRQTNVPDWVSEGLATYVEMWRNKQTKIGEPNIPWLSHLNNVKAGGENIPIAELVASDKSFDDDKTAQTAYGESWLLVHYLMKSHEQTLKFRAYLAGLASEEAAAKRVEFAEKHLGSLEKLSRDLDRYLKRVGR